MYKIKKEDLTALFRAIAAEQELYVPVKTAGKVNFGPWSEDAEVDIDTLKSVKSPKDVFFPQSENLYTCEREGRKLKVEPEAVKEQRFTVFGMRACARTTSSAVPCSTKRTSPSPTRPAWAFRALDRKSVV